MAATLPRTHRPSPWPRILLLVLLLGPILSPLAGAQTEPPGPLSFVDQETVQTVRPGETTTLVYRVVNADLERGYALVARLDLPRDSDWTLQVVPEEATIGPGGSSEFAVLITASERPTPRHLGFTLELIALNQTVHRLSAPGSVDVVGATLILGYWDNPLQPPLDGVWGAFLLNVVAWLVIALVVMLLIHPSLRALTSRTRTDIDVHIVQILKFPTFAILFAFGVKQSLEVFALPPWAFQALDRFYSIVLIIAVVYVAFRVWHEVVLIYGRRATKRLGSRVDTRLINVFDKTGGVIIVVVGLFYLVHGFGINLTVFAAGGVLVSMVIAFAAQDTLSNFFSGIHLLLDQPFKEGDDIILDTGEVTTVTKIGLRTTHLYHVANHETIIVPNNLLATHRVINLLQPDRKYKVRVDIGVAYGTDVQRVIDLLLDIARGHPLSLDEDGHRPFARFQNFGDSSLDFSVHLWIEDVYTRFAVASDIRQAIDRRFALEGIEIPFPQRVIWDGRSEKDRAQAPRPASGGSGAARQLRDPVQAAQEQEATSETSGAEDGGSDAEATG